MNQMFEIFDFDLEILRLRCEAARALGARFDLREFHEAVLEAGPLTMPLLRERVQRWIAREKGRG